MAKFSSDSVTGMGTARNGSKYIEGMRNAAAAPARPSDAEIIELVANHYGVHVATAISWLNGIDTLQAGEELGLTA